MKSRELIKILMCQTYYTEIESKSSATITFTLVDRSSSILLCPSYQSTFATGKKPTNYVPVKHGTQHVEYWR